MTFAIRTVRTARQTVYEHSCPENVLSPTNEMQFKDRKKFFIYPFCDSYGPYTDRQTVYDLSCHENIPTKRCS